MGKHVDNEKPIGLAIFSIELFNNSVLGDIKLLECLIRSPTPRILEPC